MKKISCLILCLAMILSLGITALAAGGTPKIVDNAGLLTTSEENTLEAMAEALVDEYDIDVAIVTVDSLGHKSAEAYADDYFDDNGYGVGSRHSGVLFLISMEYRDWHISTCGKGIDALTDYGLEKLFDSISDELADNDFYEAFTAYLTELDKYFDAYESGHPIDKTLTFFDFIPGIIFGLLVGAAVAAIVVGVMKRGMNTAHAQHSAQSYVTPGTFDLQMQRDIYLYSHTSRVRKSESSSSGGSSTHRSSSGRSHGGRGGKF